MSTHGHSYHDKNFLLKEVSELLYLTSLLNSQGLMSDRPGAGQWDEGSTSKKVLCLAEDLGCTYIHVKSLPGHLICYNHFLQWNRQLHEFIGYMYFCVLCQAVAKVHKWDHSDHIAWEFGASITLSSPLTKKDVLAILMGALWLRETRLRN